MFIRCIDNSNPKDSIRFGDLKNLKQSDNKSNDLQCDNNSCCIHEKTHSQNIENSPTNANRENTRHQYTTYSSNFTNNNSSSLKFGDRGSYNKSIFYKTENSKETTNKQLFQIYSSTNNAKTVEINGLLLYLNSDSLISKVYMNGYMLIDGNNMNQFSFPLSQPGILNKLERECASTVSQFGNYQTYLTICPDNQVRCFVLHNNIIEAILDEKGNIILFDSKGSMIYILDNVSNVVSVYTQEDNQLKLHSNHQLTPNILLAGTNAFQILSDTNDKVSGIAFYKINNHEKHYDVYNIHNQGQISGKKESDLRFIKINEINGTEKTTTEILY